MPRSFLNAYALPVAQTDASLRSSRSSASASNNRTPQIVASRTTRDRSRRDCSPTRSSQHRRPSLRTVRFQRWRRYPPNGGSLRSRRLRQPRGVAAFTCSAPALGQPEDESGDRQPDQHANPESTRHVVTHGVWDSWRHVHYPIPMTSATSPEGGICLKPIQRHTFRDDTTCTAAGLE